MEKFRTPPFVSTLSTLRTSSTHLPSVQISLLRELKRQVYPSPGAFPATAVGTSTLIPFLASLSLHLLPSEMYVNTHSSPAVGPALHLKELLPERLQHLLPS